MAFDPSLGGEIRKVHAQNFAADHVGRVVGEEMHAGDDAIGGENDIAAGWRRERGSIVDQPEGAGRGRQRAEVTRYQSVFGRFR